MTTFAAGQRVTAAQLNQIQPLVVYKTTATTRASTTTQVLDPDLQMTLSAGGVYMVEFGILYASGATGKLATSWAIPSDASGSGRSAVGLDSSVSNATPEGVMRAGVHGFATAAAYGDRASTASLFAVETAVVTMGAAGVVGLMWAQSVSNATVVSVGSTSYMKAQQIG